jgi:hypothetical protein
MKCWVCETPGFTLDKLHGLMYAIAMEYDRLRNLAMPIYTTSSSQPGYVEGVHCIKCPLPILNGFELGIATPRTADP